MMLSRSKVLFTIALIALTAGGLQQAAGVALQYFTTDRLPSTQLFQDFFPFWMFLAVVVAWCGFAGSYASLRSGFLRSSYLTAFGVLFSLGLKVEHVELPLAVVGLKFFIGYDRLSIGVNVVGLALLWWLKYLRDQEARAARNAAAASVAAISGGAPSN